MANQMYLVRLMSKVIITLDTTIENGEDSCITVTCKPKMNLQNLTEEEKTDFINAIIAGDIKIPSLGRLL